MLLCITTYWQFDEDEQVKKKTQKNTKLLCFIIFTFYTETCIRLFEIGVILLVLNDILAKWNNNLTRIFNIQATKLCRPIDNKHKIQLYVSQAIEEIRHFRKCLGFFQLHRQFQKKENNIYFHNVQNLGKGKTL